MNLIEFAAKENRPELVRQWDCERNDKKPDQISPSGREKAWWRCEHGHEWQARVYAVTAGSGCPYCAGYKAIPGETDLATTDPELAAEWADEEVKPADVTRGSHKTVRWKCPEGHRYEAPVYSRAAGNGCPYCSGRKALKGFNDLTTTHPLVAKQWEQTLNGALTPEMVTKGSNKKVWWRCSAGHVWQAAVFSRTRKRASDCPVCAGVTKRRFAERYKIEPVRAPIPTPARLPDVAAAAVSHDE